ncbi:hypothetical protein CONLIGDRAFT_646024 [Coniochaeta ligniaria NRRL 30616]|uniref:Tetraspanin Tsp3 n=1 Tax=Coniochaeta ligniaria NRRL 30616 TaxID=1408157 RepID=A0A1J7IKI5_9PEZI|nr:hypothetical protein CONLIGDRAFT_646024 [Coniochaeta ligniaria NRRL 30616]
MASMLLGYAATSLFLLGVAIYEHTNAAALSLPLSPASTISTILLPILSFFNTVYYATRARTAQSSSTRPSQQQLLPPGLQVLQTIITTILGTSFFSNFIPSATRECLLSTRWQKLWTTHDATKIRRIQDAFDCCGLNSVRDRAWPFPNKANPQPGCASQFGRTASCAGPWTRALQTTGGIEFGIVAAVGVLQLVNIILQRYLSSRGRRSAHSVSWVTSFVKRLTGADEEYSDRPTLTRPLLEDGTSFNGNGHHGRAISNHGPGDEARSRDEHGTNGYRGTHTGLTGARIEPSHLESSPWAGEEDSEG